MTNENTEIVEDVEELNSGLTGEYAGIDIHSLTESELDEVLEKSEDPYVYDLSHVPDEHIQLMSDLLSSDFDRVERDGFVAEKNGPDVSLDEKLPSRYETLYVLQSRSRHVWAASVETVEEEIGVRSIDSLSSALTGLGSDSTYLSVGNLDLDAVEEPDE